MDRFLWVQCLVMRVSVQLRCTSSTVIGKRVERLVLRKKSKSGAGFTNRLPPSIDENTVKPDVNEYHTESLSVFSPLEGCKRLMNLAPGGCS